VRFGKQGEPQEQPRLILISFIDHGDGDRRTYVDGGLEANNPTRLAIEEAERQFPGREIGCVVSLGCGHRTDAHSKQPKVRKGKFAPVDILQKVAVNTQKVHDKMVEACAYHDGAKTYAMGKPGSMNLVAVTPSKATGAFGKLAAKNAIYVRFNPELSFVWNDPEVDMDTKDQGDNLCASIGLCGLAMWRFLRRKKRHISGWIGTHSLRWLVMLQEVDPFVA
jgi:hypothetical protein